MSSHASSSRRVLQIQPQAEAAGAQRIADIVGEGLRAKGYDVRTIFMYRKTHAYDADRHSSFVSKQIPEGWFARLRIAFQLIRTIRSEKPDVVLTYQRYGNIVGAIAARLASVSIVVANQSGNPSKTGWGRVLACIDHACGRFGVYDSIIVNSASTEETYKKFSKPYVKRIVRIDHGIRSFPPTLTSEAARVLFGLPSNVPLLLTTGRLAIGKNQDVLIRAVASLADVHLAIAGAGPHRRKLERLAVHLGVEERVHFVGELSAQQIPEFLQAGDIFVFASSDETFGISVVEASIAGLPVVTTKLPALQEVLENDHGNHSGLFYAVGDDRGLAGCVAKLLNDADLCNQLKEAGQSLADRYSADRMIAAYEDLILRALGNERSFNLVSTHTTGKFGDVG